MMAQLSLLFLLRFTFELELLLLFSFQMVFILKVYFQELLDLILLAFVLAFLPKILLISWG